MISDKKVMVAAAPPDDELARLEREIAKDAAYAALLSPPSWYDLRRAERFGFVAKLRAARYLELRGLLERHPLNPNLVRSKED